MSRGFIIFNFPIYGESQLPSPGVEGLWIWDDSSTHIWDDGSIAIWDIGIPVMPTFDLEMQWEDGEIIEWEDGTIMYWEPHSGEVDATPDQFTFATINGALTSTLYTSNAITITGVSSTVPFNGVEEPIGIVAEVAGAEWSLNGGPWTAAEGSVYLGDVVRLRMTSSSSADTPIMATFTAGGTSATWTVRTAVAPVPDTTPDAFTFVDVTDSPLSTLHVSNYVTVSGVNSPTPLEVIGDDVEFSLNDGAWTAGIPGDVPPPGATGWFASPNGTSGGDGSVNDPWDLESALVNTADIQPGDTLWLLPGTYKHPNRGASTLGYKVGLQGASGNPIVVRPYGNGRVTIDGGLHSNNTPPVPQYVTIRDLEVIVSENLTLPRVSTTNGSTPTYAELNRPWGGVDMQWGVGLKVVNCVIHANAQGVGFWENVTGDSELYGNIIYDNGWLNPNGSPHGHGIYTQNADPENKFLRNNILIENYSFNLHAYGSSASHVENYTVEDNISSGGPRGIPGTIRNFLIGNENSSSNFGHTVSRNRLWHSRLALGFNQPVDQVTLEDNWVVLEDIQIFAGSTNVTQSGNFNWGEDLHGTSCVLEPAPRDGAPTPSGAEYFLTPNTYDSARAHLAIYNYFLDPTVQVDFAGFLTAGQSFFLLDPRDFFGAPIFSGTYEGAAMAIPTGSQMFVVYIVCQGEKTSSGPSGTVVTGDSIRLRMTSASSHEASRSALVSVGDVFDTWTITTESAPVPDTTPNAFTFNDVTDASVSTVYISNSITVTGINAPAAITVTDGEYSINGGAWTSSAGTVNLGQQVRVRHTSSASFSTATNTVLDIGGVSDTFTTTTAADPGSDATTSLASPAWLVEAEDYTETKIGAAYSSTTYHTIFQWDIDGVGTVTTVNNTTELVSAINAAKSNSSIKGVHLNPGNYTWPKDLIEGLHRNNDDAFFIRTTPGAQSQAVVSKILEESGDFSGIAFVDLDVSGGGLWLQGPFGGSPAASHDVLIERCHGYIVIQGQNMGSLTPGEPANNIMIRLCTLVDHWGAPGNNLTHGLYTWNTDWILLEGNIFDHNGWDPAGDRSTPAASGGPTSQKHNAYLNRPAVPDHFIIRFNWNSRAAATGFHLKGGGTCYRNIFSCNPIHATSGYGADGNFAAYGLVLASTVRDNLFINVDNISTTVPMGVGVWLTCIDNALIDSNYFVYDNSTAVNSAFVCRENNFPITATVSNNVAYSIHVDYMDRGAGNTPSITDTGNTFNAASISSPAEDLAFQLGAKPTGNQSTPVHADVHAWIDNFKTSRRRLGVDIEQLKTWMSTIIGGITP